MKIYAVCGFGVGSSVIAKMNIEQIIDNHNLNDVEVETVDLGSVQGVDADVFVTTQELANNFPEELRDKTIVIDNFIDLGSLEAALLPVIQ